MSNKSIVVIAAFVAALTTLILIPRLVEGFSSSLVIRETIYVTQPKLSPAQMIWLAKLMNCESGLKAGAINPNDLDNTPSYGLLQFKPSTFAAAARELGLASTTDFMNPLSQVAIVEHWVLKGGTDWAHQFPDCTARYGPPPTEKPLT